MPRIALVLLCGLPASGKTTFVKDLCEHYSKGQADAMQACGNVVNGDNVDASLKNAPIQCLHVCYDTLSPDSVTFATNEPGDLWKQKRKAIFECVRLTICLLNENIGYDKLQVSDEDIIEAFSGLVFDMKRPSQKKNIKNDTVIIIDDNMYYKSMRYEYFQLARECNVGFAQLYFPISVADALQNNTRRDVKVPDYVIVSMNEKLQPPNVKDHWETNSMTLTSSKNKYNIKDITEFIENTLSNPVLAEPDNSEEKQRARETCSKSLLHQCDQILRSLIGEYLKDLHSSGDTSAFKTKPKQLSQMKANLLKDIEGGKLDISHCLDVNNACKDPTSDLFICIKQEFRKKLHNL